MYGLLYYFAVAIAMHQCGILTQKDFSVLVLFPDCLCNFCFVPLLHTKSRGSIWADWTLGLSSKIHIIVKCCTE